MRAACLALVLAVTTAPILADKAWADDDCMITLAATPHNAPKFEDYPAGPAWHGTPVAPRLVTRDEKLFRTQLRTQAQEKPDFAGHYRIALWGCGAACVDWGMVDSQSGRVVMGDRFGDIDAMKVNEDQRLIYRLNSRLLVILGAPNEKPEREGMTYVLWTGHGFRQLAFYPTAKVCRNVP